MVRRHPRRRFSPLIAASLVVLVCAHDLSAQVTYEIVADLASVGGVAPLGGVIRGADGALCGTTSEGGAENCGIVYRLDATGQLSRIHSFSEPDGCRPVGELALGPDGGLYGVTSRGGLSNAQFPAGFGTIYKIAANGAFTVLHRVDPFLAGPGEEYLIQFWPDAGLTLGPDGFFYGTLASSDIFRISPDGAFALVHRFVPGEPADLHAALVLAPDGFFYGTSLSFEHFSATQPLGTIFRVSPAGDAEELHQFLSGLHPDGTTHADSGGYPAGELAVGPGGEVYGANSSFGPSYETDRGTLFRLAADGTFTRLHVFSQAADQSYPDGAHPVGGLILGADGRVYGKTSQGGAAGNGTIFQLSLDGGFTALRSFPHDGYTQTKGRLFETSPDVFYGTASSGTGGVVYRVAVSTSFGVALVVPRRWRHAVRRRANDDRLVRVRCRYHRRRTVAKRWPELRADLRVCRALRREHELHLDTNGASDQQGADPSDSARRRGRRGIRCIRPVPHFAGIAAREDSVPVRGGAADDGHDPPDLVGPQPGSAFRRSHRAIFRRWHDVGPGCIQRREPHAAFWRVQLDCEPADRLRAVPGHLALHGRVRRERSSVPDFNVPEI